MWNNVLVNVQDDHLLSLVHRIDQATYWTQKDDKWIQTMMYGIYLLCTTRTRGKGTEVCTGTLDFSISRALGRAFEDHHDRPIRGQPIATLESTNTFHTLTSSLLFR